MMQMLCLRSGLKRNPEMVFCAATFVGPDSNFVGVSLALVASERYRRQFVVKDRIQSIQSILSFSVASFVEHKRSRLNLAKSKVLKETLFAQSDHSFKEWLSAKSIHTFCVGAPRF